MKPLRFALLALGITALIAFGAACSSEDTEDGDSAGNDIPAADGGGAFGDVSEEPAPQTSGSGVIGDDGGTASGDLQGLLDRKIVQNTTVDLEVEEVSRSFQDIMNIALTAGGHVASSSFSNEDDEQIADLTIRVPAEEHQRVLTQLREMGEVTEESSDANDVTEEYTDLQARLRTLEATEQRYLELLAQATTIPDILAMEDRLAGVRAQIEQVQGRINLLDSLTELGTITVHLRPLAAAGGGARVSPVRAGGAAWVGSLAAVEVVATVAVAVIIFSWWLLIPAAVVAIAVRWWLRRPGAAAGGTT
jgi:hypothetical protein